MMGRPKLSHCKRGHEIATVGRYSNGTCRACAIGTDTPPIYERGIRGRKPQAVCSKGHELAVVGRYVYRGMSKGCLACHRDRAKSHHETIRRKRRSQTPVPPEPILALVQRRGMQEFAEEVGPALGVSPKSVERLIHRCRHTGFTVRTADELCVAIGKNPVEVFGPAWFGYGAEEVSRAV